MAEAEPSYIDYETFLDPEFSPYSFANSLVTSTNDPSDTSIDLSTPLSRVLFDVQEIDTHIHSLTTRCALPLLEHTRDQVSAGTRVLEEIENQVSSLTAGYERLEKEVLHRWEAAEEVRIAATRSWQTIRLGRAVARCLALGRQLEVQMAEVGGQSGREDHKSLVRASGTVLTLRQLLSASGEGKEGFGLDRVNVIQTLRNDLVTPAEQTVRSKAQQIVREFSMSSLATSGAAGSQPSASTFAQTEVAKVRTISAVTVLYLLSPLRNATRVVDFHPELLVSALQTYLQTALTSSLAAMSRALSTLPTLERTLLEVSARCQNVVALEALLEAINPPPHPLLAPTSPNNTEKTPRAPPRNLLQPLLKALDTSSLPSYFWRSLASSLSTRVMEIINRGGVSARTLRSNRDRVRDEIRECVLRGSQLPVSTLSKGRGNTVGNWEREAAVMVGSVLGALGR